MASIVGHRRVAPSDDVDISHYHNHEEVKKLNSVPLRVYNFAEHIIDTLLTTSDKLDEIAFDVVHHILPRTDIYFFGIFRRLAFLIIFVIFFESQYTTVTKSTKFVSLYKDSGICQDVKHPWTIPAIRADNNGFWEGQLQFSATSAIYTFSLYNFVQDLAGYSEWMSRIGAALDSVGKLAKTQDLALNLLYW